jgi:glycosyltransferase involved in cell wall biosynthesis
MKMALVGPTYPQRGGIAHYTSALASYLAQAHSTRVYGFRQLYPDWLFPGRGQLDPSPAPIAPVEARCWLVPWWPLSWMRVTGDWQTWRPDVVVIQWWIPFLAPMTAWLAAQARCNGIRVAVICHNVLPHERSRLDAALIRLALGRANLLIVHSTFDQSNAQALLPGSAVELASLPNYTIAPSDAWSRDRARAALGMEGRVLLFFGLVRPYKGLFDLLDALPRVLSEIEVTLLAVGEIWGDAKLYHDRVKVLGLESHVCFVDRYVSNDEAAMYFAAADLAVLPYREATGSAVLQLAFGMGVPVVATRAGGMGESVDDGETGFLVEPGDVEGLSRAIVRFFQQDCGPSFRSNVQRARAKFSWESIARCLVQLGESE